MFEFHREKDIDIACNKNLLLISHYMEHEIFKHFQFNFHYFQESIA